MFAHVRIPTPPAARPASHGAACRGSAHREVARLYFSESAWILPSTAATCVASASAALNTMMTLVEFHHTQWAEVAPESEDIQSERTSSLANPDAMEDHDCEDDNYEFVDVDRSGLTMTAYKGESGNGC